MDEGGHIVIAISDGMAAEFILEDARWHEIVAGQHAVIAEALRLALEAGALESGAVLRAPLELGILLTDDARMAALNAQFRGRDGASDVLSFPDLAKGAYLGDIALGYEILARDAGLAGKNLFAHFLHLLVHGVLHLKGYQHQSRAAAQVMEDCERAILASLGFGDPYSKFQFA